MALAIVPLDRNSGIPCPEQPAPSDTMFDIDDIPFDIPRSSDCVEDIPFDIPLSPDPVDDLDALTTELVESEGLSAVEACSQALALTDELAAFAVVWDADAHLAGHPDDHMAFPSRIILYPAPLRSRHLVPLE